MVLAPEEGIYLTLKALLKPGEHVVVTHPGYQALHEVARSAGCQISFWRPQHSAEGSWLFDVEDLKDAIQPHTKVRL